MYPATEKINLISIVKSAHDQITGFIENINKSHLIMRLAYAARYAWKTVMP